MFEIFIILICYILMWIAYFFHLLSLDCVVMVSMMVVLFLPVVDNYIDIDDNDDDENK